jgi:hypothetical protein
MDMLAMMKLVNTLFLRKIQAIRVQIQGDILG